jgi:hypothetical protein
MQNLTAGSQNLFGSGFKLSDARRGSKPAQIRVGRDKIDGAVRRKTRRAYDIRSLLD